MVAIYCRQSIDKKDSISIEQQEEYCKLRIVGETFKIYKDKGYTGANINRPEFEAMMNDVQKGAINKVIVYKVDRISRSLQDFVNIYSDFEKYNVAFESCSEQFDTSTAMGKATLQIIMVFAELERNMIQKRVKDNFYERGKKGIFLAGVAPYGFDKIPTVIEGINTHMLKENKEQSKVVKFIYNEYAVNKSIGSVVKTLNAKGYKTNRGSNFSSTAVSRILRNPVYVCANADVYQYMKSRGAIMNQPVDDYIGLYGCTVYSERKNKTKKKFTTYKDEYVQMNTHKGFIKPDLWLSVQAELDKNKPVSNSGKGTHTWLTGLTKCGYCGLSVTVVNGQRNGKRYINCGGRKDKFCYDRTNVILFDDIEKTVEDSLIKHIEDFKFSRLERSQDINKKVNSLKIELTKTEDEIKNLVNKIPMANDSTMKYINIRIEELENLRQETQQQLLLIKNESPKNLSSEMIKRVLSDWNGLSFSEKKYVANSFIEKVVVWNDDVDIVYK